MIRHQPVLLQSVIDLLEVKSGGVYLDGTIGSGGHAEAILAVGGQVYGLDVDPRALERTRQRLGDQVRLKQANFTHISQTAAEWSLEKIDGVLLDLGLSTEQIEDSDRGFSWQNDSPLDMRADPNLGVTAADLINSLGKQELTQLLRKYGELPQAGKLAEAIIKRRPMASTGQLVAAINSIRQPSRSHHPATLVFQALRIAVNDEINNLISVLPQAVKLLKSGGRLVVLSFHSLEDRIVKNFMRENQELKVITKKPILSEKPHAILRAAEKLPRLRSGL